MKLAHDDDLYEFLSDLEWGCDGGPARVRAKAPDSDYWQEAFIDADGLYLSAPDAPGYVQNVGGWRVDRHY